MRSRVETLDASSLFREGECLLVLPVKNKNDNNILNYDSKIMVVKLSLQDCGLSNVPALTNPHDL